MAEALRLAAGLALLAALLAAPAFAQPADPARAAREAELDESNAQLFIFIFAAFGPGDCRFHPKQAVALYDRLARDFPDSPYAGKAAGARSLPGMDDDSADA